MEAVILEISELIMREFMQEVIKTKCCMWSKNKWKKLMKRFSETEPERRERIVQILRERSGEENIFDFATVIEDDKKKINKITNI